MWAFFIALFGLIIYAGVKLYDAFNGYSSAIKRREAEAESKEKYSGLRIQNGEFNGEFFSGDKLYRRKFDELSIKDLAELLSGDFSYITGCECGEDYFQEVLQLSGSYKDTLRYVWLSKISLLEHGFASDSLGGYDVIPAKFSIYLPQLRNTIIYDDALSSTNRKKCAQIRVLECIERNIRKKYSDFRFVFDVNEQNSLGINYMNVYLRHDRVFMKKQDMRYLWNDGVTRPGSSYNTTENYTNFIYEIPLYDKIFLWGVLICFAILFILIPFY